MSEGKIIARRREDRPEVLYLVISNPNALNALTEEMQIDLIEKLRAARDDKSVRCVVLRGEGDRAFSSGGEVQSLEKLTDPAAYPHCAVTEEMLSLIDVLVDGRYVAALHDITLRFRGSSNQRIIDLPATRRQGAVVLWEG